MSWDHVFHIWIEVFPLRGTQADTWLLHIQWQGVLRETAPVVLPVFSLQRQSWRISLDLELFKQLHRSEDSICRSPSCFIDSISGYHVCEATRSKFQRLWRKCSHNLGIDRFHSLLLAFHTGLCWLALGISTSHSREIKMWPSRTSSAGRAESC